MIDLLRTLTHARSQVKSVRVLRSVLILVALFLAILSYARSCTLSRRLDDLTQPAPVSLTVHRYESWHAEPITPEAIKAFIPNGGTDE